MPCPCHAGTVALCTLTVPGMGEPQKLAIWRLPNECCLPPETSWELPARWMGSEEAVAAAQGWRGASGSGSPCCLRGAKRCQGGPGRLWQRPAVRPARAASGLHWQEEEPPMTGTLCALPGSSALGPAASHSESLPGERGEYRCRRRSLAGPRQAASG